MAQRVSAGVLLYRVVNGRLEVLLAHMGGPMHATRDAGTWTIPKGEIEPGEELLAVAKREFAEETGHDIEDKEFMPARVDRAEGRQARPCLGGGRRARPR